MRFRVAFLILIACALPAARVDAGEAANVRVAERVFAGMAAGHIDAPGELYGPGFVAHSASFNYTLEQDLAATFSWHEAMPDLEVSVERTVASGDMVAVHWHAAGTNTVAAAGMPGKGDRVGLEGMTFFRFAKDRIVEEWTVVDVAELRRQFGHPPMTP